MKRLIGVLVVTAAAVGPAAVSEYRGTIERGQTRGAVERVADLRSRSGRHAILAAHADHSGERQPAGGRVGVSHEAGAPAAAAAGAAPPRRHRGVGAGAAALVFAASETTPLVVNGVMYISTPYGRVVALDPTTGKEVWVYQLPAGQPSTRGVEYWPGDAKTPPQIVFGIERRQALLARRQDRPAQRDRSARRAVVNLNTPEILQGLPGNNGLSSPPIVYKNLIITGGRTQENPPHGPAGDVRAWDVHTGKLVWTFHSVPRAGEKFNDTWAGDSWKNRSGVNVWGLMTVDVAARHRLHAVRRAVGRSVRRRPPRRQPLQLERRRGRRATPESTCGTSRSCITTSGTPMWPPRRCCFDVKQGGKTIPAVAVMSKSGLLFLLDRVTGKPIYGVEERARAAERSAARAGRQDAAVSAQAGAARRG